VSWKESARYEEERREELLEVASLQVGTAVERAIRDLPPRDLLLLDRRMAGWTWAQIAQSLDMTEDAARQQWVRTKKRIRSALRREHLIEELFNE